MRCLVVENLDSPCCSMHSISKRKFQAPRPAHSARTNPQDSSRSHLEAREHQEPATTESRTQLTTLESGNRVEEERVRNETLCGVLGTLRGGLGGVEISEEKAGSWLKMEGEYGELGAE